MSALRLIINVFLFWEWLGGEHLTFSFIRALVLVLVIRSVWCRRAPIVRKTAMVAGCSSSSEKHSDKVHF